MALPDQTQQKSENLPLPDKTKKMERNLSDEHRYTPLPGNTQQKLEKKYMSMTVQTEHKSDHLHLPIKTQNQRGSHQKNINICFNKSWKEISLTGIDLIQSQHQ